MAGGPVSPGGAAAAAAQSPDSMGVSVVSIAESASSAMLWESRVKELEQVCGLMCVKILRVRVCVCAVLCRCVIVRSPFMV